MVHQETEGLLSPIIRDIRLKEISKNIKKNSLILDLACGDGFLSKYLPSNCRYFGVDRVATSSIENFTGFIEMDLMEKGSLKTIKDWLPKKPDYITCAAFLEHIAVPEKFVKKYCELLASGGKIVGTTPCPKGRIIHDLLSRIYLCSRHGALEHERFLGKKDIENIALITNGVMSLYDQFLFGLNQIFIIEYR